MGLTKVCPPTVATNLPGAGVGVIADTSFYNFGVTEVVNIADSLTTAAPFHV